ncbi:hypothetical protein RSSM_06177 [Rhodopirellula sallentina SM41]|uniref:Uncharacterized protein n=1 Tax=Rhodopirellula sallentina SM41 TaxID=1263870 RepID=M5TTK6_9BACT|nr:hypothetical protein RSSM_06177 [Rhodopirellula sallentina SM41]
MVGWWGALFLKRVWFLKRVCESSDLCVFALGAMLALQRMVSSLGRDRGISVAAECLLLVLW